jgi:four helix bundle protein
VNFLLCSNERLLSRSPPSSIHRNIAQGYCRRSLSEYLHFLNIALASTGGSVFGLHAFRAAKQIADVDFEASRCDAYKLEDGMKRLIESL